MAARATTYLEKEQITLLKKENQFLAEMILERRGYFEDKCINGKEFYNVKNFSNKHLCWSEFNMISWLEAIKIEKKIQPFPDGDQRNTEPWKYVETLSNFFTQVGDNNLVDKKLVNYSIDVFILNKKKIFISFINAPNDFLEFFYKKYKKLIYFYLSLILYYLILNYKYFNYNIKTIPNETSLLIAILVFGFTNLLLFHGVYYPEQRAVNVQSFLYLPVIGSYLIMIFFKDKKIFYKTSI
jgi:hypothetical protein